MFGPAIKYHGPVYRPPSEAESLLIQLTIGCSHNKCTFCGMYRSKTFSVRLLKDVVADLEAAARYYGKAARTLKKIFLCDGDALVAPTELLLPVLERANELFPALKRISVYATASNILNKSNEELAELAANKLNLAYLGLESGADEVLKLIVKGNSAEDMVQAASKLKANSWQLSLIAMLGLGGAEYKEKHRRKTAAVVSKMEPDFFSFLTTVLVPGLPYATLIDRGEITPLTSYELLEEMRDIITNISLKKRSIFRANHVSNLYPLSGILPRDAYKLADTINSWLKECPRGVYPEISPEML